jgi:hypothetical protein
MNYIVVHPDIAESLYSLAVSYDRLNKKGKAVEFFHKALEMRQRLYGDKHPDVIKTKNYLQQIENRCLVS